MKFEEFREQVKKEVERMLTEEVTVTANQVTKNNGVVLHGITIAEKGSNIYPNIYLNNLYEEFVKGRPLSTIVYEIVVTYKKTKAGKKINMDFFKNYEIVREKVVFKLINYEKNEELLKKIPHIPFLDLAIVFYCVLQTEQFKNASILIQKEHCNTWKVDEKTLYEDAKKNVRRLLPEEIKSMEEILREMFCENMKSEIQESIKRNLESDSEISLSDKTIEEIVDQMMLEVKAGREEIPMYVLSNRSRSHGAACILYQNLIKNFADFLHKDVYILPSSVHEVILIPAEETDCQEKLSEMVREVNRTELDEEEILSDHVYLYSREKQDILLC